MAFITHSKNRNNSEIIDTVFLLLNQNKVLKTMGKYG